MKPLRLVPVAVLALAVSTMSAPPAAEAGEVAFMLSYWDTEDLGGTGGGGAQFSFRFTRSMMLDFGARYFEELNEDLSDLDLPDEIDQVFISSGINATPIDIGIKFKPRKSGGFVFFFGAGVSYYLLDSKAADIDDQFGYYGKGGFELGNQRGTRFFAQALYRGVEGTASVSGLDFEFRDEFTVDLAGTSLEVGVILAW